MATVSQIRSAVHRKMVDAKMTATEVALVGNLMPDDVDECRALVPSTEVSYGRK